MLNLSNRSLLNKTFLADGAFSLLSGAVLILGAAQLAALIGPFATPVMMKLIGVGLLAWGIFHLSAARNGGPVSAAARVSIGGDILWQVASLALLATAYASLTPIGIGLVIVGIIGVADFLFFKLKGFSRERAALA
ncbi:hypothetical protein BLJAPNOD_00358 [Ensifer sp. M14]|uniref:hypothetical protein n=1 Tax=Sinorhizobium/Ensifer group TaxID=227292 RepID=UPI0009870692|nr:MULTISPECIES: hypothetical protein [Sinorhizobium/Ensifer group]OOG68553.1 hypothetical protein B0E45_19455 [Sinorhizobium sp. A49]RDL49261.1 hypothetical protein BLJAPNOD_00358 [Ensifer sp. M14]